MKKGTFIAIGILVAIIMISGKPNQKKNANGPLPTSSSASTASKVSPVPLTYVSTGGSSTGRNDAAIRKLEREVAEAEERLALYEGYLRNNYSVTNISLVQTQTDFLALKRRQLSDLLYN